MEESESIFKYLANHEYSQKCSMNAKRRLRAKAESFAVVDNMLMHKS